MQFDEFDNKIKEAADHHHPAYDEQAWTKMQKMLNKHLPQKEEDRRRFIFFLLLLLGLGGAGLLIAKPWKGKKTLAATEQSFQQKQSTGTPGTIETNKETPGIDKSADGNTDEVIPPVTNDDNTPGTDFSAAKKPDEQSLNKTDKGNRGSSNPVVGLLNPKTKSDKPATYTRRNKEEPKGITDGETGKKPTEQVTIKNSDPVTDASVVEKKSNETLKTNNGTIVNADKLELEKTPIAIDTKITDIKEENQPVKDSKAKTTKSKTKKTNSFFFSLSAGPDVSFASGGKPGTTKPLTGAGLGYVFNNRVTIRTGFYSGRKIYSASPDAYHPPAAFYTYYPYLEKVDADCKVYEIPLSVSYNFSRTPKQYWFASTGLSSYLMKKETYTYFYKQSPAGSTYNKKWTITDENKHYFSTLTLSGGYQRSINRNVSFLIEPYIKLSLSGVGYGKVKLNSGGVLFSVVIKPFAKKDKPVTNR